MPAQQGQCRAAQARRRCSARPPTLIAKERVDDLPELVVGLAAAAGGVPHDLVGPGAHLVGEEPAKDARALELVQAAHHQAWGQGGGGGGAGAGAVNGVAGAERGGKCAGRSTSCRWLQAGGGEAVRCHAQRARRAPEAMSSRRPVERKKNHLRLLMGLPLRGRGERGEARGYGEGEARWSRGVTGVDLAASCERARSLPAARGGRP